MHLNVDLLRATATEGLESRMKLGAISLANASQAHVPSVPRSMLGPMLANKEVRAWLEIIAPDIVPPQPVVKKPPLAAAASSVQKLKLPSSVDCRPGEDAHRIFNVLKPIKPVPDDDMWIFAATVNAEASEADARAREAESRVHAAFGNGRRGPTHLWDQNVRL